MCSAALSFKVKTTMLLNKRIIKPASAKQTKNVVKSASAIPRCPPLRNAASSAPQTTSSASGNAIVSTHSYRSRE